eukprot:gene14633-14757_t
MRLFALRELPLKNVGKVYDTGTPAVIDFNLDVKKGEFIAFLGPSGCGKTTTLRMIAGFEDISSGDILIRGRRINDVPPERRQGQASIQTEFGTFVGTPNNPPSAGARAKIVIPSESLDIFPLDGQSREALSNQYQGNLLSGVMERADVVGHLVQIAITLVSGASVTMEAHVDRYHPADLKAATDVLIAWQPQNATIIAA